MGREVRRVPADWEHPMRRCEHSPWAGGCSTAREHDGLCFQPLFDRSFEHDAREWLDGAIAWDNGTDPDCARHKLTHPFWWQEHGDPPDPKYYRPTWISEPTHYQMYETVSEGTPLSPIFATPEALIEWLVTDGGRDGKHSRRAAEKFVKNAWAPSMLITDGIAASGVDVYDVIGKE